MSKHETIKDITKRAQENADAAAAFAKTSNKQMMWLTGTIGFMMTCAVSLVVIGSLG